MPVNRKVVVNLTSEPCRLRAVTLSRFTRHGTFSHRSAIRLAWGLRTPRLGGLSAPYKHSSTYEVGEAFMHVQGESLKMNAALLTEAS
jgi:hypothetical protein